MILNQKAGVLIVKRGTFSTASYGFFGLELRGKIFRGNTHPTKLATVVS